MEGQDLSRQEAYAGDDNDEEKVVKKMKISF